MTIRRQNGSSKALLKTIGGYLPADRADVVEIALKFATDSHKGQLRDSGEPFIEHPIATAQRLADMRLDTTTIQAALLHDVMEDCGVTFKELETDFGADVAKLVDGVTKLKHLDMISETSAMLRQASTPEVTHAASLRKMLVAMAEDVRVILIKLADRLHNMQTLKYLPVPKQQRISRETLDIYSPLAHRLGMNEIKWQLEDEAFRYLMPRQYKSISRLINRKRAEREMYTEAAVKAIQVPLQKAGLECSVEGRVKHLYSTYNKLQRYERIGRKFDEIYDLIAIRVIAETVGDCYAALGVVHSKWRPVPGQFDDYIASPKENMYQSLHTSVRGPGNYPIEVQIRTQDMHEMAEEGVASHWMYKGDDEDGSPRFGNFDQKMSWLRQLVDWQRELSGDDEYLATVRTDILQDQVFVYTPKGDVKDLPAGATPIDFAYRIHTDLGHNTVGAVVNGKLTALNTPLQNGDVVEIRKARIPRGPSLDWLNADLGYMVTGSARTKVKQWFRKQERQSNIRRGKDLLKKELRRLGLDYSEKDIVATMDYESLDELAVALGIGQISIARVAETLSSDPDVFTPGIKSGEPPTDQTKGLVVMGEPGLPTRIAKCCSPVYGDEITGYLTRGRGVTVHRRNCPILRDAKDPERNVPVAWGHYETTYASRLQIEAFDRVGLIRDITNVVSSENVNIHSLTSEEDENTNACTVSLTVYTTGVEQLSRLFSRVETIPGVNSVFRVTEAQGSQKKEPRKTRQSRKQSS